MNGMSMSDECVCGHARRDHIGVELPEKPGSSCYHQSDPKKWSYDCHCRYFERPDGAVTLFRDRKGRLHSTPEAAQR